MLSRLWDFLVETLMLLFLPAICSYHLLCADLFLNVAAVDAVGFEKAGNFLLTPVQYLFAGRIAIPNQEEDGWTFEQKSDYREKFWEKTTMSAIVAIPSFFFGSAVKGLSFLFKSTRLRHASLVKASQTTSCRPNLPLYQEWGIALHPLENRECLVSQGYKRRPGDEKRLQGSKEALAQIGQLLNEAKILWWVDCGTCLGTYRYGGIIPWDDDIDIAILVCDFENVRRALNQLNPLHYQVQDWSGRNFPHTFFKVYLKESGAMIDIICFKINLDKREIASIFSLNESIFFPEWFKIRERPFSAPVSFDVVFPLKKASFDGVDVFVPNRTKEYLQRLYGKNLEPAKIYNPKTGQFEKDLTHPYWQKAYAH